MANNSAVLLIDTCQERLSFKGKDTETGTHMVGRMKKMTLTLVFIFDYAKISIGYMMCNVYYVKCVIKLT